MSEFDDLITAYRMRFHNDPPLMGLDNARLARRIREALELGRPIEPWTWQEGQLFDRTTEIWPELHYEPDPGNPETSFVVACLSRPTGTVFTVQLEPGNLPDSIDPGPIMDWVRQELDSFISFLDVQFGPIPSGPSVSAIGERPPRIPTTSCAGMLWWRGH